MKRQLTRLVSACLLLGAVALLAVPGAGAAPPSQAVAERYIVVFKDAAGDPLLAAGDLTRLHGLTTRHVYRNALRGFAATIPGARLAALRADPRVLFVTEDRPVYASQAIDVNPPGAAALPAVQATQAPPPIQAAALAPPAAQQAIQAAQGAQGAQATAQAGHQGAQATAQARLRRPSPTRIPTQVPAPSPTAVPAVPPPTDQLAPTGITRAGASADALHQTLGNKGAGLGVAVLDTGIDLAHPDLRRPNGSGVQHGINCVGGASAADDNGHGTHVAGTIAARDDGAGVVGVAPDVTLYAVKVLDGSGSGSWSSVICGIDWVAANAGSIRVANMSLSGWGASDGNCGYSNNDPLHRAVCRARDAGVIFVVAAGNAGTSATGSVPAAYTDAVITVGALADADGRPGASGGAPACRPSERDDAFASFSNYGPPVALLAPGVCIRSTWPGGGYATLSGTSMASPHVAGAAALWVARHSGATLGGVRSALQGAARQDVSGVPAGTDRRSLYVGSGSGF